MRDRQAYVDAGRNDPHDDQQRLEHPYDFVSLPATPAKGSPVLHDRVDSKLLTGTLRLKYRLDSPLHVGSGGFENAKDLGLDTKDRTIRGMVRSGGQPVLPGSSWKGVVRSRFEAITDSRLGVFKRNMKEASNKLPDALKEGVPQEKKYSVKLEDPALKSLQPFSIRSKDLKEAADPTRKATDLLQRASPADLLFGCMGYLGRVRPGEGRIEGPAANAYLEVPAQESPQPHRLAKSGAIEYRNGWPSGHFAIDRLEGRKFYYDGDLRQPRESLPGGGKDSTPSFEPIDHVPAGATLTIEVSLACLSEAEIGALLIAAGKGEDVGIIRFGGYKSAGLGKATLVEAFTKLFRGPRLQAWQRGEPEPFDMDKAVETARASLVKAGPLRELHDVTTLRRPQE